MKSFQRVTLCGTLGRDPDIRSTQTGRKVANLSLAVDEGYINQQGQKVDHTEWIKVTAWADLAEIAEGHLSKGEMCVVIGKLRTRKWTDKEGKDQYTTEVLAEQILPAYPRKRAQGQGGGYQPSAPAATSGPRDPNPAASGNRYPEDSLPF